MNHNPYVQFNALRSLRLSKGLRQIDVAKIIGFCNTDRISHWEQGKAVPSLVNLFRLSKIYDVLPHELYPSLFENITTRREKVKDGEDVA